MKRMLGLTLGVLVGLTIQMRAADPLTDALQKGLVEEEANQNLDAAIKAYQDVLARAEEQRRVAATALFRLAECYRKQGKTNEATAEYRRLLRDYVEQSTLVNLSRQNLTGLDATPTVASTKSAQPGDALTTDEEQQEIQHIRALIKNSPDLINSRTMGNNQATLLHTAASKGHLVVTEFLLANGAEISALDYFQATPLFNAAQKGHKRMVELLLTKGAQPSPPDGPQPLHIAVERNFKAVAEVLLAHKANVNLKQPKLERHPFLPFPDGMTALHIAIKEKNLQLADLLLSHGAEPNVLSDTPRGRASNPLHSVGNFDGTPLHFAVQSGNASAVRLLLEKGADAKTINSTGLTPLHSTANPETPVETAVRIAELLIAAGANINAAGAEAGPLPNWTPLHVAVYHRRAEITRLLLNKGADPNLFLPSQSGNERTALNIALIAGAREIIGLLLDHKADANARDHNGDTPLVRTIRIRDEQLVRLLLSKGANPNLQDGYGFPPLQVALGAQLQSPSDKRIPPLVTRGGPQPQAVGTGTREPAKTEIIAELLLKYKADPNQLDTVKDKEGETPLHLAARNGDHAAVELLLKYKADPNARTDSGATPLHWAVQGNRSRSSISFWLTTPMSRLRETMAIPLYILPPSKGRPTSWRNWSREARI